MNQQLQPNVKIISCSGDGEAVCAGAARISTTAGDAYEIFERSRDNPNNPALIQKVLRAGHKSLLEHAVFTIAFRNVSAYAEQFFIESRLASFTVKSRRYVDFSSLGYHVPPELNDEGESLYHRYMSLLFDTYQALLQDGVPKEDARFLLPYSFCSNFYCTVNARELVHILSSIRHGRGRGIPELQAIADRLTDELKARFPSILSELMSDPAARRDADSAAILSCTASMPVFLEETDIGQVALVRAPQNPVQLLELSHRIARPNEARPFDLDAVLQSERPRELEQLSYTFTISNLTLSGLTHLVRHRMQSILIPPIESVCPHNCVLPETVKAIPAAAERYRQAAAEAYALRKQAEALPSLRGYGYYFTLSGSVMEVMTTMNARELLHFIRLRSCNRAQWEIRSISEELLRQLREHFPQLFDRYGPGCFVSGTCPEGSMTCKRREEVISKFSRI